MGRAVVDVALRAGWSVLGMARSTPPSWWPVKAEYAQGRVESADTWRRIMGTADAIVHLAAPVHQEAQDLRRLRDVTVSGAENAAVAARDVGARLLLVSTVGVYGAPPPPYCDELTPLRPETPYATAKIAAENRARDEYGGTIVLRSAAVYGPGDRGNVARLITAMDRGRGLVVGSGSNHKSIVYSYNLAERILRCVSGPSLAGTWCVADQPAPTQRELADTIARSLGRPRPRSIPLPLAYVAAIVLDAVASKGGRSKSHWRVALRSLSASTEVNGSALDRRIGYSSAVALEKAIQLTVANMKGSQ